MGSTNRDEVIVPPILAERQERILLSVVEDYVTTGRPVGSAAVLARSGLDISSATIRNELSHLEEMGLLLQLHTSGGRIPTTAGYRYYVHHLLPPGAISNEEQITIRHQFHQAQSELDEWMRLATAVLAHRAHNVAVVTAPRTDEVRFKHVELIETQPHTLLAVVLLQDGSVLQEMMTTEEAQTQESLRSLADVLNRAFFGRNTLAEVEAQERMLPSEVRPYAGLVLRLLRRTRERRLQIYHQGLGEMLTRPEFSPHAHPNLAVGDRLKRVVDFLQQGLAMEDLLGLMSMESGVQVVIGGEAPLRDLEDYSMVVGRYGADPDASGMLGLLGPTRMDYGRAISLVRYMTEIMSNLFFDR